MADCGWEDLNRTRQWRTRRCRARRRSGNAFLALESHLELLAELGRHLRIHVNVL
jgi:hypothetical protein